jgi:alpha-mannosidase
VPGPDEEVAVNTYPHHFFVDVNDGSRGLAILSRGLTEYEAIPTAGGVTLALTLLRSVGWLSKADLETRFGHAGPGLPTPEAQCIGRHVFEYAIMPHNGGWTQGGVLEEAERYIAPAICAQVRYDRDARDFDAMGPSDSFLSLEPSGLMVSALKKAEHSDALIVRLYNPTSEAIIAHLGLDRSVREVRPVDLAEREIVSPAILPDDDGVATLEVGGYQICSLKLMIR